MKIQEKWGKYTPAYRFSCNDWLGESDIVLVPDFGAEQSYKLRIYIDAPVLNKLSNVLKAPDFSYKNEGESNNRWDCYLLDAKYSSVNKGLENLGKVAKLVDDWHVANGHIIAK